MNKLKTFVLIVIIFLISFPIYAQRNLFLQSSGNFLKDTQIRSNQDSLIFTLQQDSGSRDAFIYNKGVDTTYNFGKDTSGYIGNDTLYMDRGVGRGLFTTDSIKSYIPANATILSVKFTVYRDTNDTSFGSGMADLHSLAKYWTEGSDTGGVDTVNWEYRTKIDDGGAKWDSVGGEYIIAQLDSESFTSSTDSLEFGSTDSMVAMIQRWVDGDSAFGVLLKTRAETCDVYFPIITSDDTINTGWRPRWRIEYVLPYNYGADTVLYVGYDTLNHDTSRVLIENDSIQLVLPSNATITQVRLGIFVDPQGDSINIDSGWVYLYELDSTWDEGSASTNNDTANWIQRLKGGDTTWKVAGGDYTNFLDSAFVGIDTTFIVFESDSLDTMVQRWVNGIRANNGVILTSNGSTHFRWYMTSSDDTTNDDYREIWDIWYSVPIDTGIIRPLKVYSKNDSGYIQWVDETDLRVEYSDTAGIVVDTMRAFAESLAAHGQDLKDSAKVVWNDSSGLKLDKSALDSQSIDTVWAVKDGSVWVDDLYGEYFGDVYSAARDTVAGNIYNPGWIYVGQEGGGIWDFMIMRSFLTFPNAKYLSSTTIDSIVLELFGYLNVSNADFGIYILSSSYTGITYTTYNDFDGWTVGSGDTGAILNDSWNSVSYIDTLTGANKIKFTSAGIDSLKTYYGDSLRICLISKEDYDNSEPTEGHERIEFFSSTQSGTIYDPRLIVYVSSGELADSLADKLKRDAFKDSVAAIDSTYITDSKLGISDINNLGTLINEKLDKSAFDDSVSAIDSTYITDSKLGIGDINNLLTILNSKMDSLGLLDSLADKLKKSAFKDSVGEIDSTYITDAKLGIGDINNLGTLIGLKLDKSAFPDTFYAHYDSTITVALTPNFYGWSYSLISAHTNPDTNVSVIITGNNARTGLDTSWYLIESDTTALDSIGMKLQYQLSSDFDAFDTDSAIVISYNVTNTTTTNNYIEVDIFKWGNATNIYNGSQIATAVGWNNIVITSSDLSSGGFVANDKMVLIFTIGIKDVYPVKISETRFRYKRY